MGFLIIFSIQIEEADHMSPEFTALLSKLLGPRFSKNIEDLESHSRDESFHPPSLPDAVCYPNSVEEIVSIVKYCNQYVTPLVAYGTGTGIEGQSIPSRGGLSLDMKNMNSILSIHEQDQDCVVQAGVTKHQLNNALKEKNLFFPAGPQIDASFGGMASTRASGINALRYGTMSENILSLSFVSPTGALIKTGGRARKSAAGYDLTHLLVGAEGTLGIITDLTLKLSPLPQSFANSLVSFESLNDAVQTALQILQTNIKPGAMELLDIAQIQSVNEYSKTNLEPAPHLFIELHGEEEHIRQEIKIIENITIKNGGKHFQSALKEEERTILWQARADCYYANQAAFPGQSVFVTDVCVPISNLVRCINETYSDLEHINVIAPLVGHIGDGNFHLVLGFDPSDPQSIKKTQWIHDRLIKRAIKLEGTCTGEHGIGMGKKKYLIYEKGMPAINAMKALKQAWDPNNIMNPGKTV